MLTDTHTHLYVEQFAEDRAAVIDRAIEKGVNRFYLPNIDSEYIDDLLSLEAAYPEHCFAMMGLHPCSVKENYEEELAIVEQWLKKRPFVAVGEIGLDLYWDKTTLERQIAAFEFQIAFALSKNLPISVHVRDAFPETIAVLEKYKDKGLRGVLHCFTGSLTQAEQAIDLGFYLGVGGVLTFKNAGVDKTIANIDLKHLILETDSPYLAPTPHRGKPNEPSFLPIIAKRLAEVKNTTLEEVAAITSENAQTLFKLS